MVKMQVASAEGGQALEDFANISGVSAEQFKQAFETDAYGAIDMFIQGLASGNEMGDSAITMLDEMGISEVRLRDAILRTTNAEGMMKSNLELSNKAWEENSALTNEAEKRYATTASQLAMLKNKVYDLGISLGEKLLPHIKNFVAKAEEMVEWFGNLSEGTQGWILKLGIMGPLIGLGVSALGKFTTGIGTFTKGLGGGIELLGKWATKHATVTAATTATTTALEATSVAAGGVASSMTGIAPVASTVTTALSGIGAAVPIIGGVAIAVGVMYKAFEENQDKLDASTKAFKTSADTLDSFSGKVRTTRSEWAKIFGEDITIKFSADFEQGKQDVQVGYNDLNDKLKAYYEEKYRIDHDGCEDEQEHYKHKLELKENYQKDLVKTLMGERQDLKTHQSEVLTDIGTFLADEYNLESLAIGDTQGKMNTWLNEKVSMIEENESTVFDLRSRAYSENRELTEYELNRINELEAESGQYRALIESGTAEDIFNAWDMEYKNENLLLENSARDRKKYLESIDEAMWDANKSICSAFDEQIAKIKEADWLDEETKAEQIKRLQNQKSAVADFTEDFGLRTQQNIKSGDDFKSASKKAFDSIVKDLESGAISSADFGMTNEEYMGLALISMAEAGASADDLTDAIEAIPENKRADVLAKVEGKDKADSLKEAIDKLQSKTINVTTNYKSTGLGAVNYKYVNGVAVPAEHGLSNIGQPTVAYTNEPHGGKTGFELIDGPAIDLGQDSRGYTKTLLGVGASVKSNLASQSLMMRAVQSEVAKAIQGINNTYFDYGNSNSTLGQMAFNFANTPQVVSSGSNYDDGDLKDLLVNLLGTLISKDTRPQINLDAKSLARTLTPHIDKQLYWNKNHR